jgi:hypothetical protein
MVYKEISFEKVALYEIVKGLLHSNGNELDIVCGLQCGSVHGA